MPDAGPHTWSTEFLAEGLWIDGVWFEAQRVIPGLSGGSQAGGVALATMGATQVEQFFWIGGDAPVGVGRLPALQMSVALQREADYWLLEEWRLKGRALDMWFDWPRTDVWYVPGQEDSQTEWKLGRKTPWGLVTGINQTSRPPRAYLDGTELSLVASPPSDATEFSLANSADFLSLETVVLAPATYTWLVLRYHPILTARLNRIDFQYQDHNRLVYSLQIEEVRGASFGAAA
jgi:hypothetical protein